MNTKRLLLGIVTYGLTITTITVLAGALWANHEFTKPGPQNQTTEITIPRGANIGGVADLLSYQNIITRPILFRAAGRLTGQATKIKAGEYEIPANTSIKNILNQLEQGQSISRRFTIREGLTSFETVRILKNIENLTGDITTTPPEGALLPNTYDYQRGENRTTITRRLQNNMIRTLIELCQITTDETPDFNTLLNMQCAHTSLEKTPIKTVREVLTLASIIEKETAIAEERAKVAGVFLNRLKRGIPLQTDPTVIYAITKGKHKNDGKGPLGRRLLRKDLAIDSPYNTYKNAGLPPGPIANPGRAAIKAVLNPETHDYIYFVANGTGGHAFAKTLKQHNQNVAKWRKIRKAAK